MRAHRYEPDDYRPEESHDESRAVLVFDRESVRQVDRAAIEEFGIPGIVLMENAARGLARETLDMLDETSGRASLVLIFCGAGNNGGDGYALARDLHNAGVDVAIVPVGEPREESDAGVNCRICQRIGIQEIALGDVDQFDRRYEPDLIVDAIFGTGLDRAVTGETARAIHWINTSGRPVLAVDVPSGMDCNTGKPLGGESGAVVKATKTVTFVGLKSGFDGLDAQKLLGEVAVVDIGAPPELLERFGHEVGVNHMDAPDHCEAAQPVASPRSH
jgi:NAD(P)H-hydrate epimerase